jgi:hypothetical protein
MKRKRIPTETEKASKLIKTAIEKTIDIRRLIYSAQRNETLPDGFDSVLLRAGELASYSHTCLKSVSYELSRINLHCSYLRAKNLPQLPPPTPLKK